MNEIDRFASEGMEAVEGVMGDSFRWGTAEYRGIFSEVDTTLDQRDEGYYVDADFEVVVRRNQFANTEPRAPEHIEWQGRRFVIRDRQQDNVHITLQLKERPMTSEQ